MEFQTEDVAAEIEYIKIKGVSYATHQCNKCTKGVANQFKDRCEHCPANEFLDDLAKEGGTCQKCPPGKFSPPGSLGLASCKQKPACLESDYMITYSMCNAKENTRVKEFNWKPPRICDEKHEDSVALPAPEPIHCKGCGPG